MRFVWQFVITNGGKKKSVILRMSTQGFRLHCLIQNLDSKKKKKNLFGSSLEIMTFSHHIRKLLLPVCYFGFYSNNKQNLSTMQHVSPRQTVTEVGETCSLFD